ncbi:MAG TPA: DUF5302 family protein [Streptosporangiaceae bacterium]|jgi:hypothetical protein|nr:DUF5302 family protein [Streptosporangiaceae bacterium]
MAKAKPGRGPAGRKSAPAAPEGAARRPAPPDDEAAPPEAGDDLQRKFREALERKRAQQADSNAQRGGPGGGKVTGAHGPAQSRRSFRRKSGG